MDEKAVELGANDSSSVADSVADLVDVDRFYDKHFDQTEHEPDYESYRGQRMNWSGQSLSVIDPVDDFFRVIERFIMNSYFE
ncbi:hypothetical protein Q1J55_25330 [Pseudomonas syringae]|uniref:hypothetical protein n=1 Tax=Pseudomonas syringae group TaxID=136849 RepID=UPI0010FA8E34|nr:hypothetical protein [Pseudomonas viridiflava]